MSSEGDVLGLADVEEEGAVGVESPSVLLPQPARATTAKPEAIDAATTRAVRVRAKWFMYFLQIQRTRVRASSRIGAQEIQTRILRFRIGNNRGGIPLVAGLLLRELDDLCLSHAHPILLIRSRARGLGVQANRDGLRRELPTHLQLLTIKRTVKPEIEVLHAT